MPAPDANTVALIVYRLSSMIVGLALAYMGYRLFLSGLFEKAGDLKAAWGQQHLELKQAAPGTVYALLGAVVIVVSLVKGFSVSGSPVNGIRVFGRGMPVSSAEGAMLFASSRFDLQALSIAHRAVAGERITQAERDTFLTWYGTWGFPFDTSLNVITPDSTNR